MRIALLGATGPTGTQLLTLALARDLQVTALVRDPARLSIKDPRLTVVVGDATSADDLVAAMKGSDAVLAALGSGKSRKSDVASRAAAALVKAADSTGVDRVIWLSALGVGASNADGSQLQRMLWKAVMGQVFADKAIADHILSGAGLRYTLVYPTTLSNKPGPGTYTAGIHLRAGMKPISRAAVAQFMLDQLTSDQWLNAIAELAP
jgi:putative NADH-flavin reductase